VLLLTLGMALFDVVGVASIMPFMAVVADPRVVETNGLLARAYRALGFSDPQRFLLVLGIGVFVTLVASQVLKALGAYAQLRFALMREASLSERLMSGYLRQPYQWFLNRHSADLGNSIVGEVSQTVYGALMPMMVLIAQGLVLAALLALLLAVNVRLALTSGAVLALAYGLVYALTSRQLARQGAVRLEANVTRVRTINEAFSGVKEIKVGGHEAAYLQDYRLAARRFGSSQAITQTITQLPRFALEAVAFGGMVLVVLVLMAGSGELSSVLPIIALYAFAGYRLMPAAQQVYASVATLRTTAPVLHKLHGEVMALPGVPAGSREAAAPLPVRTAIALEGVTYRYPGAPQPALRALSLRIPAGQTVGLVGSSGSGKTTTVDIILGLLEPEAGTLRVDDAPITAATSRRWQRTIG
jgi:ABC-type bacteriocin/lantibiotic exporter with double-glycine peptidase domain